MNEISCFSLAVDFVDFFAVTFGKKNWLQFATNKLCTRNIDAKLYVVWIKLYLNY